MADYTAPETAQPSREDEFRASTRAIPEILLEGAIRSPGLSTTANVADRDGVRQAGQVLKQVMTALHLEGAEAFDLASRQEFSRLVTIEYRPREHLTITDHVGAVLETTGKAQNFADGDFSGMSLPASPEMRVSAASDHVITTLHVTPHQNPLSLDPFSAQLTIENTAARQKLTIDLQSGLVQAHDGGSVKWRDMTFKDVHLIKTALENSVEGKALLSVAGSMIASRHVEEADSKRSAA